MAFQEIYFKNSVVAYIIFLFILRLNVADQSAFPLKYEAPDDCQWWLKGPNDAHEVSLTCKLRTINSEFDTTNFSVIPSEHTTSLRIECNEEIMYKSSLDDRSFAHLVKLRELILDNCKIGRWPPGVLSGLRDLRNLTVRTKNTEWSAMSLEIASESFTAVRQLEKLDLSFNNIWSFPENLFCPLTNLVYLNVSSNRLQDVSDLGFRERAMHQALISEHEGPPPSALTPHASCSLDIEVLDASYNHFVLMPENGFHALRRLKELHIHDNEISMVADKALAGLKQLQIIDLSNNKIVALPQDLFKDCRPVIKEIYLQNNSISVLSPTLFANLDQLLALDLSNNHLTSTWINENTFAGLIRMVLLNLSNNRLTKLDPKIFKDLYTLQILNVQRNMLESIAADTFAPMNNLHTLILSYNKISHIDAYALNGLYVLSLLSIDNNRLEELHPEAFRNTSSLQDLNLNSNRLKKVPTALRNMRLLRTLDLGENQITSLEEPGFVGLHNVYGLRLIGNKIENISKDVFSDLPSLQILNLARNKLRFIDMSAFENLKTLQAIRLDANQITDVQGLFVNIPSLLWLNVSDNKIDWFDYSVIPTGLQWLDLHSNNIKELGNNYRLDKELRLQTLDASFNKMTKIFTYSIPSSIELLFLNDNQITQVEAQTFVGKTNLTRVDLYANQITSMDLNALRLTPVDPGRPLPEFYIGGNPFQCDCTMEWLQRINKLDHLRQHPRVMDLESIYCKLLYNRERTYIPLVEAESSQFLCTYKTHCFTLCHCCDFDACDCEMTCPSNCTCYHDQPWSANIVDCSAAGYSEIPNSIPMDATELYLDGNNFGSLTSHAFIGRKNLKILYANNSNIDALYNNTFSGLKRLTVLHLEKNNIKELLGFELSPLENLRELHLQDNKIHYIDNRTFIELMHLEVLRLEGNNIYSFAVWQFTMNPYLVEISLSRNPWSCDCLYIHKFRNWFRNNLGKVEDAKKITCIFDNITNAVGPHMSDFNSTICTSHVGGVSSIIENQVINDYLPLLLISLCVFVISSVLICGVFYWRRELRVWIYYHCGFRMCYKSTSFDDEADKDRLFDAYISYSVKDEAFVAQMLAPGLESTDPSFRLCLHYRDFNASAYVADTIIEAVESSKRTIIVLSKNFINNEWCRFEFKTALHEVLKERRRRLIIILLGDLPNRDIDPELRLCLKANTCIEWGDRQFWQKLRFAMPDLRKCQYHRSTVNIYASVSPLGAGRAPAPPPPPPPGKLPPLLGDGLADRLAVSTSVHARDAHPHRIPPHAQLWA
ncbi:toll-like receptor 6 [Pieris brassicae]|uniref:toll-like receptor 6 n=1 Tax=Pieris brassicae TaxID=7116 RepID=UPI001E6622CB|nr:toll-like receptor 6 [Pieris brassicae]